MYLNRLLDVMFADYMVDIVLCLLLCSLVVRCFNEIRFRPRQSVVGFAAITLPQSFFSFISIHAVNHKTTITDARTGELAVSVVFCQSRCCNVRVRKNERTQMRNDHL